MVKGQRYGQRGLCIGTRHVTFASSHSGISAEHLSATHLASDFHYDFCLRDVFAVRQGLLCITTAAWAAI